MMSNKTYYIIIIISLILMTFSCTPSRVIRPLAAKEIQVGASLGGPIINFAGAKIPVPFTSLYAAYGLDSSRSIFGGVHTTAAAAGVAQIDIGLTQSLWRKKWLGLECFAGF